MISIWSLLTHCHFQVVDILKSSGSPDLFSPELDAGDIELHQLDDHEDNDQQDNDDHRDNQEHHGGVMVMLILIPITADILSEFFSFSLITNYIVSAERKRQRDPVTTDLLGALLAVSATMIIMIVVVVVMIVVVMMVVMIMIVVMIMVALMKQKYAK